MAIFICSNCKYRFEKDIELADCPYCGEKKTVSKEQTAEDLLGESGE